MLWLLFFLVIFNECLANEFKLVELLAPKIHVYDYSILIEPFFEGEKNDLTFDASIGIHFMAKNDLSLVQFNSKDHTIHRLKLINLSLNNLVQSKFEIDAKNRLLNILADFYHGHEYMLEIDYSAFLSDQRFGFFYVKYPSNDWKTKKTLVAINLVPFANHVFPCIDNPNYKSTFNLTVIHYKNTSAFHNTLELWTKDYNADKKITKFKQTPLMSVYLLALVVGEFDVLKTYSKSGVLIRTISTPETILYTKSGLEVTAKCVDFYEQYFMVKLPLEKLDSIEIRRPGKEFAIENFGSIIYSNFLTYDPNSIKIKAKIDTLNTFCHEIGNMVTLKQWNETFLHEGIASFLHRRGLQHVFEEERELLESSFIYNRDFAMHLMDFYNNTLIQNDDIFEDIIYASGSLVMRMIEQVIGPKELQFALSLFVQTHQYRNADLNDFFTAIETVVGNPFNCENFTIREFISDYLSQSNYPVVKVALINGKYSITQHSSNYKSNARWHVPLFIRNLSTNKTYLYWLLKSGKLCPTGNAPEELNPRQKYIFNYKAKAFIRVNYSSSYLDDLIDENLNQLDENTLLAMVQDVFSMDEIKLRKLVLKLVDVTNGKLSSFLIHYILETLYRLEQTLTYTHEYDLFQSMYAHYVEKIYQHVEWKQSNDLKTQLTNEMLLARAVSSNISNSHEMSIKFFEEFRSNCSQKLAKLEECNRIPPDFRHAVYVAAIHVKKHQWFLVGYFIAVWNYQSVYKPLFSEKDKIQSDVITWSEDLDFLIEMVRLLNEDKHKNEFVKRMMIEIGESEILQQQFLMFMNQNNSYKELQRFFLSTLIQCFDDNIHDVNKLETIETLKHEVKQYLDDEMQSFMIKNLNYVYVNVKNYTMQTRKNVQWLYNMEVPEMRPSWYSEPLKVKIRNISYDLLIEPNFSVKNFKVEDWKEMTIDSYVEIEFTTNEQLSEITLHSHQQQIINITATIKNETFLPKFKRNYTETLLFIKFGRKIASNTRVKLTITYISFISMHQKERQRSIVLSKYYNSLTKTVDQMLTTQLSEGTNPRALLPCFDSPNHKAIWRLKVRHFHILKALGNGEVESIRAISNQKLETTFKPTKLMAGFTFAFELGEYQSISGMSKSGIPVELYAANGYQIYGQLALETSILGIEYFNQIFGLKYNEFNTKLDLLAFKNFYGSMENWSLIVMNEPRILYDKFIHTLEYKRLIFSAISHEIIHQWFGDLLATLYWDQEFLSESLARLFENEICEEFIGHKDVYTFINGETGMQYEERDISPNMEQINSLFPTIITDPSKNPFRTVMYNKLANALNTLRYLIGNDNFKQAIQVYIRNNSFGVVENSDFFDAFDQIIKEKQIIGWNNQLLSVKDYFQHFNRQASFPIIFVETNESFIEIRQEPIHNVTKYPISYYDYKWNLPIFLMNSTGNITHFKWLIGSNSLKIEKSSFFVVNPRRLTFARVLYDNQTWLNVLQNFELLDEITKVAILTDTYAFAKQKKVEWSRLFDFIRKFEDESSEIVWKYTTEIFMELLQRLKPFPNEWQKLKSFIEKVLNKRGLIGYERQEDWEKNDSNSYFVKLSSQLKITDFVKKTAKLSINLYNECLGSIYGINECFRILPEHRSAVLCSAIQEYPNSIEPPVRDILLHYGEMSVDDPFLRDKAIPFINALGCIEDTSILQFYINASIYENFDPFVGLILKSISQRDKTQNQLYIYFVQNFDKIISTDYLYIFINSMTYDWSTKEQLNQLQLFNQPQFLNKNQQKIFDEAIEQINKNIQWSKDNLNGIFEWLKLNY